MERIAEKARVVSFVVIRILILACIVALLVWRSLPGGPGVSPLLAFGLCGVAIFAFLMLARYIPGDLLRRALVKKFPTAVVVTCRMNPELSSDRRWLDVAHQEAWASNSLPLGICLVGDSNGISFWSAQNSISVCLGQFTWKEVATVERRSKIVRYELFPTLYVELDNGFDMNVLLGSRAVFGMWPAKTDYIGRAVVALQGLRKSAA
jgi:hypothetical protein